MLLMASGPVVVSHRVCTNHVYTVTAIKRERGEKERPTSKYA